MPIYEVYVNGKPRKIEISKVGEKSFNVKLEDKSFTVEVPEGKLPIGKEFQMKMNGKTYAVALQEITKTKPFTVKVEETPFKVELKAPTPMRAVVSPNVEQSLAMLTAKTTKPRQVVSGTVTAPMTGKVISIKVQKGEQVKAGQVLCILEAMKMENEITAPTAGIVREILVSEGAPVNEGDPLFVIG